MTIRCINSKVLEMYNWLLGQKALSHFDDDINFNGKSSILFLHKSIFGLMNLVPRSFLYISSRYLNYNKCHELIKIKERGSLKIIRSMFYNNKRCHLN